MEEIYLERELYIDQIKDFIDKPLIKIITGLRRSGKSSVLNLIKQEVLKRTDTSHIIHLNFEDVENQRFDNNLRLNDYLLSLIKDDGKYYIFLDEPQLVADWEKTVNGFRLKNTDIYITGSNSKLLSSEFSTLLGGRIASFNIHGLSFREFIRFRKYFGLGTGDTQKELDAYISTGGFPFLSTMPFQPESARRTIQDINSTAVLRDVIERKKIRNPELMKRLLAFVYGNVGKPISINAIAKYLKDKKLGADNTTIAEYLGYCEEAFIVHRVQRYDIKGKELLDSPEKIYLGEHSLQYALFGIRPDNRSGIIENIVYLELTRRGYKVTVGSVTVMEKDKDGKRAFRKLEVDFVAEKLEKERVYVQVCLTFNDFEATKAREFAPLLQINDHYPKYVVTLDEIWQADENGVKGVHLKDFLLKGSL